MKNNTLKTWSGKHDFEFYPSKEINAVGITHDKECVVCGISAFAHKHRKGTKPKDFEKIQEKCEVCGGSGTKGWFDMRPGNICRSCKGRGVKKELEVGCYKCGKPALKPVLVNKEKGVVEFQDLCKECISNSRKEFLKRVEKEAREHWSGPSLKEEIEMINKHTHYIQDIIEEIKKGI